MSSDFDLIPPPAPAPTTIAEALAAAETWIRASVNTYSADEFRAAVADGSWLAPPPVRVANLTWNLTPMWTALGLPAKHNHSGGDGPCLDGSSAGEHLPALRAALAELESNEGKYRPYDAKNGWGTTSTMRRALRELIDAAEQNPELVWSVD